MILGYFLIESSGTPLIVRDFYPVFRKDMVKLVPAVISAINSIAREALQAEIKEIRTDKGILYIGVGKDYFLILLSDTESPVASELIKNMKYHIEKKDYSMEDLIYNDILVERLKEELDDIIMGLPAIIQDIKDLNSMLKGAFALESEDKFISPTKIKVKASTLKVKIRGFRGLKYAGKTLEDAVNAMIKGNIHEALGIAATIMEKEPDNDLAKALYVKGSVILNKAPPHVDAPSLEETLAIAEKIKDEFLKYNAEADIYSIIEVEKMFDRYAFVMKHLNEIIKVLGEGSIKSKIYAILFHDIMLSTLYHLIIKNLGEESPLRWLLESYMKFIELVEMTNIRFDKWLREFSEAKTNLDRAKTEGKPIRDYLEFIFSLTAIKIFTIKDVSRIDIERIFAKEIKEISEIFDYIMTLSKGITPAHIRLLVYIFGKLYPLKYLQILYMGEELEEIIRDIIISTETAFRYIITIREASRDRFLFYVLLMAMLIDLYAMALSFQNKIMKEVTSYIDSLLNYDMRHLNIISRALLIEYYARILTAILNSALSLSSEASKKAIISRGLKILENLARIAEEYSFIYWNIILDIARIVYQSGIKEESVMSLLNEIKNNAPPVVKEVIEKL